MKRFLRAVPLALLLTSGAAFAQNQADQAGQAEHAAEQGEHHEGIDPTKLALQFLNFGVLLFLLIKFGGSAINKSLRARHEQLKSDLEEAARLRATAELRFKEQEQRLANLENELETMRQSIHKEAEAEKARIIAAAEEQAQRLKADAEKQITAEIERARLELKRGVAEAAVAAAEQLLQKQIGADDQRKMAEKYVTSLEKRPS